MNESSNKYPYAIVNDFQHLSRKMIGSSGLPNDEFRPIEHEKFKATFGVTPEVCSLVWNMIIDSLNDNPVDAKYDNFIPVYMLWSLYFLKMYPTQRTMASVVGPVCPKNFRYWTSFCIKMIASLSNEKVSKKECNQ